MRRETINLSDISVAFDANQANDGILFLKSCHHIKLVKLTELHDLNVSQLHETRIENAPMFHWKFAAVNDFVSPDF